MTRKVRASSKIQVCLEGGEKLTMQVTDFFREDCKLEFVAYRTFDDGQTTTYSAQSFCLGGWTRPGREHIPLLSIYMDCKKDRKDREFIILPESTGDLGKWLQACCNFSMTKGAYYTPKYFD